ncbi:hypothetical protein K438DRAFT_1969370 [Mycena galopus ATCC 62051]|nr:hypothetical protein K438DRAFT_1969370 [Mycena galopus ATCC 62051]
MLYIILSYDIACQYYKNLWTRMETLPATMWLQINLKNVWFKVPNFHLPPHIPETCHSAFSFHYMWGAGTTHGETVEQNWEFSNGAVASTKMMGVGTRHATLEDLFGFHNWRRLVAARRLLPKRMAENMKEGQVHREAFEAFNTALKETAPKLESRQHTDGRESPFELKEKATTLHDIQLKLAKGELLKSGDGGEIEQEDTPSTFLAMGVDIEETQRALTIDVKAVANPTEAQTVQFMKWRVALTRRLRAFRKMQLRCLGFRGGEAVRLFMPSELLDKTKRVNACALGLPEVEAELRVGEAREALGVLRQDLRTRTMTNQFRVRQCTGQRMLTRGQGVLHQINLKVHRAKLRYRYARNTLKRLKGNGSWEKEFKVLEDSDVRALNERALTAEEAEQRKRVHAYGDVEEEGGVAAFGVVMLGEKHQTLLWIWYTAKEGDAATEKELVKGRAYRVRETTAGPEIVVLLDDEDDTGAQSGDEEGPPDYEDEADDKILE